MKGRNSLSIILLIIWRHHFFFPKLSFFLILLHCWLWYCIWNGPFCSQKQFSILVLNLIGDTFLKGKLGLVLEVTQVLSVSFTLNCFCTFKCIIPLKWLLKHFSHFLLLLSRAAKRKKKIPLGVSPCSHSCIFSPYHQELLSVRDQVAEFNNLCYLLYFTFPS